MKPLYYLIILSVITFGCKKNNNSQTPNSLNSGFEGKYNGPMTQIQSGTTFQTVPITFEVFDKGANKIKLLYVGNNLTAEANLNGNDFTIIPDTFSFSGGTIVITGNGKFGVDNMTLKWIQALDNMPIELTGTLDKL